METYKFYIILSLFAFLACNKTPETELIPEPEPTPQPEPAPNDTCRLYFYFQPEPDILPFSYTRSMPPVTIPEPGENDTTTDDLLFNRIEYAVYDLETKNLLRHKVFNQEDEELDDFGSFLYDIFEPGEYIVTFFAHSTDKSEFSDNILYLPKLTDSFHDTIHISITPTLSELPVDVILKRMICGIEFVAKDKVPDKVHAFRIDVSGIYQSFNFITGVAKDQPTPYSFTYYFNLKDNVSTPVHSFYTLIPLSAKPLIEKVILTALDKEEEIIRQREITNIPLYRNKKVRYSGILYSPDLWDGSFEITIEEDGEWGETIENELD